MHSKSLDDKAWLQKIDSDSMLQKICQLPQHLNEGFKRGTVLTFGDGSPIMDGEPSPPSTVVFFGLGGSAIAGEIICHKMLEKSSIPALVTKRSSIPSFIDSSTLCFIVSYSGNTKETINCYMEAIEKNAQVVVITSGGMLEKLSLSNKNKLIKIPDGYQPRAALGFLIGAALGYLAKLNILKDLEQNIGQTVKLLSSLVEKYQPSIEIGQNSAKQIANEIYEHLPLIYASETLGIATANRWKAQLNENAETMAFSNYFPELSHNEIMGNHDIKKAIIYLKNPDEKAEQLITNKTALQLLKSDKSKLIEVAAEGDSRLQKMLSVMLLGDLVSAYLAILREVDPTPVDKITKLKAKMQKAKTLVN